MSITMLIINELTLPPAQLTLYYYTSKANFKQTQNIYYMSLNLRQFGKLISKTSSTKWCQYVTLHNKDLRDE